MAALLELSDRQVKEVLKNFSDECQQTDKLEKLALFIVSCLSEFSGADWSKIKRAVDKQFAKAQDENDEGDTCQY